MDRGNPILIVDLHVQIRNGEGLDGRDCFESLGRVFQRYVLESSVPCLMLCELTILITGAAPVSRSYVGESANQIGLKKAKAMGLFGFCFSLGAVIGPLIWRLPEQGKVCTSCTLKLCAFGCSDAVEEPNLEGHESSFAEYLFLLPCAVLTVYNVLIASQRRT